MNKLARLVLFFSLSFAIILVAGTGFRFLLLRVQWMRHLPIQNEAVLTTLISAAHWALSVALYGSFLLSLSYIARRGVFAPFAILFMIVLSLGFTFGISLGLEQWKKIPPQQFRVMPPGDAGLILTQGNTSIVLLKEPGESRGPRVTAFPDRSLLYQADPVGPNNTILSLPPLPLGRESPWFIRSMGIDFRLNAEQISGRFSMGFIPFFIYTGALVFFLASLGFIFKLSLWPLANLFTGILVFRLILGFETLLNSPEMQDAFMSFFVNRLPASIVVPLIFCGMGILVYVYSILVYLAKRRSNEEDFN